MFARKYEYMFTVILKLIDAKNAEIDAKYILSKETQTNRNMDRVKRVLRIIGKKVTASLTPKPNKLLKT